VIVYTVIIGDYDDIYAIPENVQKSSISFYIVSDKLRDVPSGWELLIVENNNLSYVEFNRFYKMHPHVLFDTANDSLYIDANISVRGKVEEFYSLCNEQSLAIAMFQHPERCALKGEILQLKILGYDYFFNLNKAYHRYKFYDLNDVFFEANIIYRKHSEEVKKAMFDWFYEFSNFVKRDQLSLKYICFKNNIDVYNLGEHDARNKQNYFRYTNHKSKKNKSKKIFAKYINKVISCLKLDSLS
jgi:hypothetical protein